MNVLKFCPCCATSLSVVPSPDLNFCYKCGTNMRAIRLAIGFVQQPPAELPAKKPNRNRTDEDKIAKVRQMRAEGRMLADIGRELHLAKSTVSLYSKLSYKPRRENGRRTRALVTPDIIAQVLARPNDKHYKVASDLGISRTTVMRIRNTHRADIIKANGTNGAAHAETVQENVGPA